MTSTGRRAIGLLITVAGAVVTQQALVRACLDPWVALIGAVVVGTVAGTAAQILLKKSQERRDAAASKRKQITTPSNTAPTTREQDDFPARLSPDQGTHGGGAERTLRPTRTGARAPERAAVQTQLVDRERGIRPRFFSGFTNEGAKDGRGLLWRAAGP